MFAELIGARVTHKKFGVGTVIAIDGDCAVVDFGGDERKLSIKTAFYQSRFVLMEDVGLQKKLDNYISEQEEEQARKKQLEKELCLLQ